MATASESEKNEKFVDKDETESTQYCQYDHAAATGLQLELYVKQRDSVYWPKTGQHILAQYTDTDIVVYQAFKQSIACYAVQNQRYAKGLCFLF